MGEDSHDPESGHCSTSPAPNDEPVQVVVHAASEHAAETRCLDVQCSRDYKQRQASKEAGTQDSSSLPTASQVQNGAEAEVRNGCLAKRPIVLTAPVRAFGTHVLYHA